MASALSAVLVFLLIFSAAIGLMIEGSVNPHRGDRSTVITINYWVNESLVNPRVKVYLSNYAPETNSFNTSTSNILIDYFNVNPSNLSPITLTLNNSVSNFYRVCLGVRADGRSSTYTDCDKDNQFLLVDDTPININVIETPVSKVKLAVNAPKIVIAGKPFIVNVSLTYDSPFDTFVKVYSYVVNDSRLVSDGFWTTNLVNVSLSSMSTANLSLSNTVRVPGYYTLVVKAKHGSVSQVRVPLIVVEKPVMKVHLNNIKLINNSLRIVASNSGNLPVNATLIFVSKNAFLNKTFLIKPKHSREFYFNTSGFVNALLLVNNSLIDYQSFYVNDTELVNYINLIPFNNTLTGSFVAEPKESLLYSLIVITSLMGLWLVFK